MSKIKKVLILGGGFGGVKAALELCGEPNFEVTLISDHPDFRYYPSLFEAATGRSLSAASIPLKEIFSRHNIKLVLDEAAKLDRGKVEVITKTGQRYGYDELIIALGSVTNFFGIKGLAENSYGIKTPEDAEAFRQHLHSELVNTGKPDLAYVVIGGGPTGVELAGSLPAYLNHVMKAHKIEGAKLHIDLVEAAPRLLPNLDRRYSRAVARRLRRLGIKLMLGQSVSGAGAGDLELAGHEIASHTIVWTAGVATNPFLAANGFELTNHGKAMVDDFLRADEHIWVIGDNAATPYSGMAQTALHDAVFVAENLKRAARGKAPKAYKPKRPAYIIPVGPRWAAVQIGKWQSFGWLGWLMRRAADFIGYHDFEPWWQAAKHLHDEAKTEADACPICAGNPI